jgi:DNA topoisomerase-1
MLENMTLPIVLRELSPKLKGLHTYFVDEEKNEVKTFDKEKVYEVCFKDEESAKKLKDNLDKKCEIYKIDEPKLKMRNPNVPFKTSTMQQEAIYKLGMNIGKVTSTAQKLYEGIKLNGKHTALISYPRTDSIRLADSFVNKTKSYITKELGEKEFFYRTFESKASAGKNVQDAHEGIRVIDPFLTPDSLKNKISHDEYSLYKLIWKRSVAAYMNPSKIESTAVRLINNENKFFTRSSKVIYPGYRKVWEFDDSVGNEKIDFTKYKVGDKLEIKQILIQDGKKASPPRYNQASLVKELDEQGVGRPSTYRSMAQIALDRGYAYLDNKAYVMNPLGNEVIEGLEKFFPEIVDAKFTRDMEGRLDEIARNDEN